MKLQQALEIVTVLSEGKDPFSGEVFADNSPYQHPDTVRALYEARDAMVQAIAVARRRQSLPENTGARWEDSEVQSLLDAFDAGVPLKEIASVHKRTQGAIKARLVLLGKLSPEEVAVR